MGDDRAERYQYCAYPEVVRWRLALAFCDIPQGLRCQHGTLSSLFISTDRQHTLDLLQTDSRGEEKRSVRVTFDCAWIHPRKLLAERSLTAANLTDDQDYTLKYTFLFITCLERRLRAACTGDEPQSARTLPQSGNARDSA